MEDNKCFAKFADDGCNVVKTIRGKRGGVLIADVLLRNNTGKI